MLFCRPGGHCGDVDNRMPEEITLEKASFSDCDLINKVQAEAFAPLLEKYHDTQTNPAAETETVIRQKMMRPGSSYYFIKLSYQRIGTIRVVESKDTGNCRISPICILPAYQGRGYAQKAMLAAEALYPQARRWQLDTIKEEPALCRLYEKMGYNKTGREIALQPGMTLLYYAKDTT